MKLSYILILLTSKSLFVEAGLCSNPASLPLVVNSISHRSISGIKTCYLSLQGDMLGTNLCDIESNTKGNKHIENILHSKKPQLRRKQKIVRDPGITRVS